VSSPKKEGKRKQGLFQPLGVRRRHLGRRNAEFSIGSRKKARAQRPFRLGGGGERSEVLFLRLVLISLGKRRRGGRKRLGFFRLESVSGARETERPSPSKEGRLKRFSCPADGGSVSSCCRKGRRLRTPASLPLRKEEPKNRTTSRMTFQLPKKKGGGTSSQSLEEEKEKNAALITRGERGERANYRTCTRARKGTAADVTDQARGKKKKERIR